MCGKFKVGDIVKHKGKFLRSIGWYIDVPKNGKVVELSESMHNWPKVQWCDSEEATLINPVNIMLDGKPDYD